MADLALAMSTAASNRASTYLLGEPMEFQQVVLGQADSADGRL